MPSQLSGFNYLCRDTLRVFIAQIESASREEEDAKAAEAARHVRQANLLQVKTWLENDVEKLRAQTGSKLSQQVKTALELKYVRDRQMFPAVSLSSSCRVEDLKVHQVGFLRVPKPCAGP